MQDLDDVDPQLRSTAVGFAEAWRDAMAAQPDAEDDKKRVAVIRQLSGRFEYATSPEFRDVIIENVVISDRRSGDLKAVTYRPKGRSGHAPALIYIHGGGYVGGSTAIGHLNNCRRASRLGIYVVAVDYRLAPEHPYPAAIDDCYAALAWLHTQASRIGIDTARVGVVGESAGAGLAASLSLLARDRGEFALSFQHLTQPMLDNRASISANPRSVGKFVWTPEDDAFGWRCLLGPSWRSYETSPYAAAARAVDLTGLPATFIAVGTLDLFLASSMEFATRLLNAAVPVELHVFPGVFHGFQHAKDAAIADTANWISDDALMRQTRVVGTQVDPA